MDTTRDERRPALAELERDMRELLGALDGARTGLQGIERAWQACRAHAPALVELAATPAPLAPDERQALRAQLERLLRLNAISSAALLGERARVESDLRLVTSAREHLRELEARDGAGESCDIAG